VITLNAATCNALPCARDPRPGNDEDSDEEYETEKPPNDLVFRRRWEVGGTHLLCGVGAEANVVLC